MVDESAMGFTARVELCLMVSSEGYEYQSWMRTYLVRAHVRT